MPDQISGPAHDASPQATAALDADTPSSDADGVSGGGGSDGGVSGGGGLDGGVSDGAGSDGAGSHSAGSDPDAAPAPRRKKRHRVRNTIMSVVAVLMVLSIGVAVAAVYDVHKLTRNLKHAPLLPLGVTQPPEPVDAFGDSPVNILLIGSDSRDTSADASLGGDADSGARADSEMIVHLSADRSNATVISIPRDTVTQLPKCAGGYEGMVNSALQFGGSCQVEAVHDLTGLTIDHFILFDFSGVVSMSQDVGGIPVCVSANIEDPNSHLKLDKGTTNVEGLQALQFLRTRDAFYDGSDIGRERATHYFFSQLIQQMKASASFTNLGQLQSLAEDVTKYTTVDDGLDSASALIGLGEDLNKVPADRITFLIMPWSPDPQDTDRVVPDDPEAQQLFADIGGDQSFTTSGGAAVAPSGLPAPSSSASGTAQAAATGAATSTAAGASSSPSDSASPSTSASPSNAASAPDIPMSASPSGSVAAAVKASESAAARAHPMKVAVINSSGTTGRAETVVQQVFQDGFVYVSGSDSTTGTATTTLEYEPSEAAAAKELAADLHLLPTALEDTGSSGTMTLVIGSDWSIGSTFPTSTASAAPAITVPQDSYEENASTAGGCITANPLYEF
jgi:LCP family protein required for cell wall assembly